jgi:pimeloyl-ACP methyl ester carboxylesterase
MSDYSSPYFSPKADPATTKKIINKLVATNKSIAISVLKQYLLYDKISSLQNLNHPLICLNSDRFPTNGKKLKSLNQKIETTILQDTGHFMMLDNYEKFNAALETLIKKM